MSRLFLISLLLILLTGCGNNSKYQYTGVLEGTAASEAGSIQAGVAAGKGTTR